MILWQTWFPVNIFNLLAAMGEFDNVTKNRSFFSKIILCDYPRVVYLFCPECSWTRHSMWYSPYSMWWSHEQTNYSCNPYSVWDQSIVWRQEENARNRRKRKIEGYLKRLLWNNVKRKSRVFWALLTFISVFFYGTKVNLW